MSASSLTRRIGPLVALQTGLALLLTWLAVPLDLPPGALVTIGVLELTLLFWLAENSTADLPVRDQVVSVSVHELVAAFALVLAGPAVMVGARTFGGLLVQLRRNRSPVRVAFNVSMFALDAAVTVLVFRGIAAGATTLLEPRVWVAAVVAIAAGQATTIIAVGTAMALTGGRDVRTQVVRSLGLMLPFMVATTTIGVVLAQLWLRDSRAAWLAVAFAALWWMLLRTLEMLGRRYGTLLAFHDHTAALQAATTRDDAVAAASAAVHALIGAPHAEVHLVAEPDSPVASRRGDLLGWDAVDVPAPVASTTQVTERETAARALRAAIVEPLRDRDGHEHGYLLAGWTAGRGLRTDAQRTLGTIARQVEASLSRLSATASLHDELAEKHRRSLHDRLTELPNRSHFVTLVEEACRGDGDATVLLLELEGFRSINETLGHDAGDVMLRAAGARLVGAIREQDVVARFDGQRFAVLTTGPVDGIRELADRLRATLGRPYGHKGMRLEIRVSVGAATAHDDSDGVTLVRRADSALNRARDLGLGMDEYRPGDDEEMMRRLQLAADLRPAIARGEVVPHFQPKIDAETGRLRGVEALARWHHARLGMIPPNDFIGLAERTGAIADLTVAILDRSLALAVQHRARGLDLTVSVNVAAQLLRADEIDLAGIVADRLEHHGVPGQALLVELTESAMIETEASVATLDALRDLGVGLSIDDFGTGYSSLAYLQRLSARELKVDRSFVDSLDSTAGRAIVQSTVELAHSLGMRVVAEGVEDMATFHRLRRMGCDEIQGWAVAPALDATALEAFVHGLDRGCWTPRPAA